MVALCQALRREKYCCNHIPLGVAILRNLVLLLGYLSTRHHGHRLDQLDRCEVDSRDRERGKFSLIQ